MPRTASMTDAMMTATMPPRHIVNAGTRSAKARLSVVWIRCPIDLRDVPALYQAVPSSPRFGPFARPDRGKFWSCERGRARLSPSLTALMTLSTASATTRFASTGRASRRAVGSATPPPTRVPSTRANRPASARRIVSPTTGSRRSQASRRARKIGFCDDGGPPGPQTRMPARPRPREPPGQPARGEYDCSALRQTVSCLGEDRLQLRQHDQQDEQDRTDRRAGGTAG